MKKTLMVFAAIFSLSFLALNADAQCYYPQEPGSDWVIPNSNNYKSGSTVYITGFAICNNVTATPSWYSSNYITNFPSAWRPIATRVFNVTNTAGAVFQMTVYTNGNVYIQQVSGPNPGRGTILSGGSYSIDCPSC